MTIDWEEKGLWWLPEKEEEKFVGTLSYSSESGGKLEIWGILGEEELADSDDSFFFSPVKQWKKFPVILGESNSGKYYTLWRCVNAGITAGSFSVSVYRPIVVIRGKHFSSSDEVGADSLIFQIPGLTQWFGQRELKFDRKEQEFEIKAYFQKLEPIKFSIQGMQLILGQEDFCTPKDLTGIQGIEYQLGERTILQIEFPETERIDKCIQLEGQISAFFSLALGIPVYSSSIQGQLNDPQKVLGNIVTPQFEVFRTRRLIPEPKELHRPKMYFTFDHIAENPGKYFEGWLRVSQEIPALIILYADVLYGGSHYIRHRFSDLLAALRCWYQVRHQNASMAAEANPLSEVKVIQSCLEKIVEMSVLIVGEYVGLWDDFASSVATAKIYLDVENPGPNKKPIDPIHLVILSEKLKALVELWLLKEIGFSDSWLQSWFNGRVSNLPKPANFLLWED